MATRVVAPTEKRVKLSRVRGKRRLRVGLGQARFVMERSVPLLPSNVEIVSGAVDEREGYYDKSCSQARYKHEDRPESFAEASQMANGRSSGRSGAKLQRYER